jgi:hypothetical protein
MCSSLQETEASEATDQLIITPKQSAAMTLHQGHSAQTTQRYYLKKRMEANVIDVRAAHKAMYADSIPSGLTAVPIHGTDEEYLDRVDVSAATHTLINITNTVYRVIMTKILTMWVLSSRLQLSAFGTQVSTEMYPLSSVCVPPGPLRRRIS